MSNRGQDKNIRRNSSGGRGSRSSNCALRELHNEVEVEDAIGSNNGSPFLEDIVNGDLFPRSSNDPGGAKRKFGNKFESRVELVLKANEAADPTVKESVNATTMDPPQRVRTKHMHIDVNTQRDGNVQNELNGSEASATSAKRNKGQRGKYRSLVVEKKTRGGQLKLEVEIPDFVLQSVGDNARNLVNYCGYVVRTTTLMDAETWDIVAAKYGEVMWNQVKNKFKIKESEDHIPRLQAFVMYALQRLYRYWKCRLYTYYKECGTTHEERLESPPSDFPLENWRHCCETFTSPAFQKRSIRNTQNRNSDKWCKHTTGNLSFPEVEDILTKKNDNIKPSADVIWLAEHTQKNDQGVLEWVDDQRSKKIHTDLHQCVLDKDKEGAPQTQEEMLLKVLGHKSGYTRGKGSGYGGSIKARLHEE